MAQKAMTTLFGPTDLLGLVKGIRAANNESAAYSASRSPTQ